MQLISDSMFTQDKTELFHLQRSSDMGLKHVISDYEICVGRSKDFFFFFCSLPRYDPHAYAFAF